MTRLTADQRQWIIEQPDQPSWLIRANFEERFGRAVSKQTVCQLRHEARGTSNAKYRRDGGAAEARRRAERIAAQTNYRAGVVSE